MKIFTTSKIRTSDQHIFRVLQMNPIGVGAVPRRGGAEIVHRDSNAVVKLQMALRAVLNCYSSYCYIETSIESKCLQKFQEITRYLQFKTKR